MKFSLILLFFTCCSALAQSDLDASILSAQEALTLAEQTREKVISKAILDKHYYQPQGKVKSLTHFNDGIPQNKWVFDADGNPLLQFTFDKQAYSLIQLDPSGEELNSKYKSPSIQVEENQITLYDKMGKMKEVIIEKDKNTIVRQRISSEIGAQESYKFDNKGQLIEVATENKENNKNLFSKELKYNSDGTLKEYASNEKGNKKKIKLEYQEGQVSNAEVGKKKISYTSAAPDDLGSYSRFAHTNKDSFLIATYDTNSNFLSQGDNTYRMEYAEMPDTMNVPRELEEKMIQHYYYMHKAIDSMSYKLKGNGYARNEWVMDMTRYPFLIGMRENRHLDNKPALGSVMVPSITYGPLEEIFSNDKATFYKLYMEEDLEVYFNSKEKMNKHLIRMRAKYKKARFDKDEENNCVKVVGSKGYIMVKKDKKTGLWEIT